jgi:membrane-associated protease RseP (regulator of RpoE activity)
MKHFPILGSLEQFRKYCGLVKIARCGFAWEKTTKRPIASVYTICETAMAVVLGGLLATHTGWAAGDALNLPANLGGEFLLFSSQGFLGVDLGEVDSDRAKELTDKDGHGAEVVMVDHDAPAGKSGLKVHDVILQLDGQPVENVDQLRRRLREMPSGRTITLLISRDGNRIYFTVKLCDRAVLQQQAWSEHIGVPEPPPPAQAGRESFIGPAASGATAFLDSVIPKALYVGADVNPVRTQLADYFGVKSGTGLLVESVDYQSPAARAGLKAGDVVVKVNAQPMTSRSDWLKAIRNHRGQQVQLTVMRNKQEQILMMSDGRQKKH